MYVSGVYVGPFCRRTLFYNFSIKPFIYLFIYFN